MAYLLIAGSDNSKYGSLEKGFSTQCSLGNDQYPKTIAAATDALSQHKFDDQYYDNKNKARERKQLQKEQQKQQNMDAEDMTSFAQSDNRFCYICGDPTHVSPNCPKKGKVKREDWYVAKMHQHLQESTSDEDSCCSNERSESRSNNNKSNKKTVNFNSKKVKSSVWSGFQFNQIEFCFNETEYSFSENESTVNMKDYLWIDCGSTLECTLANSDFATDKTNWDVYQCGSKEAHNARKCTRSL